MSKRLKARAKTVPMRYRRMEFNAQLQKKNEKLEAEREHYQPQIDEGIKENNELRRELAAVRAEPAAPSRREQLLQERCEKQHAEILRLSDRLRDLNAPGFDAPMHLNSAPAAALELVQQAINERDGWSDEPEGYNEDRDGQGRVTPFGAAPATPSGDLVRRLQAFLNETGYDDSSRQWWTLLQESLDALKDD